MVKRVLNTLMHYIGKNIEKLKGDFSEEKQPIFIKI